jgi:hypothetical protein
MTTITFAITSKTNEKFTKIKYAVASAIYKRI